MQDLFGFDVLLMVLAESPNTVGQGKTGGASSGIRGQQVKYYKAHMLEPDLVVALQRGEELEPIVGVVERFFGVEVVRLGIHPAVVPTTVDERMAQREESMRRYFDQPLQRFRVRPTVFMPSLPPLFDLSQLDRLLVGLSDGEGGFTGIGYLEPVSGNGGLRLISPVAEPPKALRLGSVRLEARAPSEAGRPPEPLRNRMKGVDPLPSLVKSAGRRCARRSTRSFSSAPGTSA